MIVERGIRVLGALTLPAKTVSEAVAGLVGSVLRSRERHGGSVNWRPASVGT
jgi:hypothetical protein